MTTIRLDNGQPAVRDGKVAVEQVCCDECCGGVFHREPGKCCQGVWHPDSDPHEPCAEGEIFLRWGPNNACCGCVPETIFDGRVGEEVPTESVVSELCCPRCGDWNKMLPYTEVENEQTPLPPGATGGLYPERPAGTWRGCPDMGILCYEKVSSTYTGEGWEPPTENIPAEQPPGTLLFAVGTYPGDESVYCASDIDGLRQTPTYTSVTVEGSPFGYVWTNWCGWDASGGTLRGNESPGPGSTYAQHYYRLRFVNSCSECCAKWEQSSPVRNFLTSSGTHCVVGTQPISCASLWDFATRPAGCSWWSGNLECTLPQMALGCYQALSRDGNPKNLPGIPYTDPDLGVFPYICPSDYMGSTSSTCSDCKCCHWILDYSSQTSCLPSSAIPPIPLAGQFNPYCFGISSAPGTSPLVACRQCFEAATGIDWTPCDNGDGTFSTDCLNALGAIPESSCRECLEANGFDSTLYERCAESDRLIACKAPATALRQAFADGADWSLVPNATGTPSPFPGNPPEPAYVNPDSSCETGYNCTVRYILECDDLCWLDDEGAENYPDAFHEFPWDASATPPTIVRGDRGILPSTCLGRPASCPPLCPTSYTLKVIERNGQTFLRVPKCGYAPPSTRVPKCGRAPEPENPLP